MRMSVIWLVLLGTMALVSCDKAELMVGAEVRGTVVDVKGEPIPGVVVSVTDPLAQCLTNGLGEYSLRTEPGRVELHFMKTGYTSGTMLIEDTGIGTLMARPLSLWRLPQTTGLFVFEDYKYRRTAPLMARPFLDAKNRVIYGMAKLTDIIETQTAQPLLLCYNTPSYDARLCKLGTVEAAPPDSPASKDNVWVFSESIPLAMAPVDEPQRLLWEVRLTSPLEPGIYALHWGALDGFTSTDERVFVFAMAQASGESSIPADVGAEGAQPATDSSKEEAAPEPPDAPDGGAPEESPAEETAEEAPAETPDEAAN